MITQLQLTHSLAPYTGKVLANAGLILKARLYSPTELFTELELKASSLQLVIRDNNEDGYASLVIPVSPSYMDEITARVSGNLELQICNLSVDGSVHIAQTLDYKLDDFRFDSGANKSSYTLVIKDDFSAPTKASVLITQYVSKQKQAYSGSSDVYVFSVNPITYREYSIGASFSDGITAGIITNISLRMTVKNLELLIEVEE